MGVPKFFRYMAERYPCLLERIKEYQIPEFDNLYLDMNGIVHMCSHPDDYDPHFRISEEKIFADIFHYINILFSMIKPQKVFFMAIDGVAPRAKMNQQRGRRFRTAKEAEKLEAKARDKGELLPEVSRFDSNCITPGTVFMAKLHQQLKYFVVKKITQDKLWRKCKIILSGPETPGEGEHKIMDYIRYIRAQPGYNPNTRHCLYGLDADLIMLGLCTHEPHFSLLREEVHFGRKNSKRKSAPEAITFYLLHLSLMREYLEMEFLPVKNALPFEYNMENIIDDWILMGFLVGNDFIPHLPNLHINKGALPVLYTAYMKILPTLDGYINENGQLNLERFEKFMAALCSIDLECFTEQYADLKYFESKTGRRPNDQERTSYKPKALVEWDFAAGDDLYLCESLENNVPNFTKSERVKSDSKSSETSEKEMKKPMNSDLAALIKATDDMILEPSESNLDDLAIEHEFEDIDGQSDIFSESSDDEESDLFEAEFKQHKKDYYRNKLEYVHVTPEVMRNQAEGYVRAIQWNLNYYYNGVCSWSWYYPHHYSPFISDIKDFKDLKLEFDLGKPFQPYEQLLAVLPAASKVLLPECYHELMTEDNSPIKDYYPMDFTTDLNGKRQDWEAVVLIPFIDESKLLDAMAPCNELLTPEEIERNSHGPMLVYQYTEDDLGVYEAPEFFKNINNHHAMCTLLSSDDIRVPVEKLVKGAYPGAKLDVYYSGFPTLKHLKYTSSLEKAKVKVFDQPSRDENMIIKIVPPVFDPILLLATQLLDTIVFVGWPHLVEAMVSAVSCKDTRYVATGSPGQYNVEEIRGNVGQNFEIEKNGIIEYYKQHLGIDVGPTDIVVHVKVITGRKYIFTKEGRVNLEKQWAQFNSLYPLQTIVRDISIHEGHHNSYKDIEDVFPVNSICFMLAQPHYGHMGTVMDSKESLLKGRVRVSLNVEEEPNFEEAQKLQTNIKYMTLNTAVGNLGISKLLFTKITGAVFIIMGPRNHVVEEDASKLNIGLNLKFNKKNEEVPGYTKKEHFWLYSQKTVDLVEEYMDTFPKLFDYIRKRINNDMFFEYDIFPEDEGSGKSVREIVEWLKQQPFYSVDRKVSGSEMLDPDVIKEMERIVDEHAKQPKAKNVVKMLVKPNLLFQPDLQIGSLPPDPATTYYLYDRVVNVRDNFTVPLGYTGSVIAIHKPQSQKPEDFMYDVMFDKPFEGGMALNCSQGRGYRMSRTALINRSYGARHLEEKTGKAGHLIQQLTGANLHKIPIQPPPQMNANQQHIFIQPHPAQPPMLHNPPQQLLQQRFPMPQQQIDPRQNFRMPFYRPQNSAFASWNQPMPNNFGKFPCSVPMNHGFQMANFPVPNQPMKMPMIPPVLERKTDFMPNFVQTKPEVPVVGSSQNSQDLNAKKVVETRKEENVGNEKKVVVEKEDNGQNAVVLKKMLKINDEPLKEEEKNDDTTTPLSVQDIFAYASANMLKLPQASTLPVAATSYSLQLLSHYQTQGLGCPHYKYFDSPNGTHCQAQLTLPNSAEVVFGEPALTKELACESVAKKILAKLNIKDAKITTGPIPWFPTPPKQWCESDKTKSNKQSKNKPQFKSPQVLQNKQNHKQQGKKESERGDIVNKSTTHKSNFVPLQAVKQHRIHKTSVSNDTADIGNNSKLEKSIMDKKIEVQSIPIKSSAPETKSTKPRRERKMRIAANFSASPKVP